MPGQKKKTYVRTLPTIAVPTLLNDVKTCDWQALLHSFLQLLRCSYRILAFCACVSKTNVLRGDRTNATLLIKHESKRYVLRNVRLKADFAKHHETS